MIEYVELPPLVNTLQVLPLLSSRHIWPQLGHQTYQEHNSSCGYCSYIVSPQLPICYYKLEERTGAGLKKSTHYITRHAFTHRTCIDPQDKEIGKVEKHIVDRVVAQA